VQARDEVAQTFVLHAPDPLPGQRLYFTTEILMCHFGALYSSFYPNRGNRACRT
jgi:hypothetical protein